MCFRTTSSSQNIPHFRDEIIKQTEIEFQLTAFRLVVASAFLSLGLRTDVSPFVPLLYSLISLFLAIQWISRIRIEMAIADYIIETFEQHLPPRHPPLGWERWSRIKLREGRKILGLTFVGARGLFLTTPTLAVLRAIYRTNAAAGVWHDLWQGVFPAALLDPVGLAFAVSCVVDIALIVMTEWLLRNR